MLAHGPRQILPKVRNRLGRIEHGRPVDHHGPTGGRDFPALRMAVADDQPRHDGVVVAATPAHTHEVSTVSTTWRLTTRNVSSPKRSARRAMVAVGKASLLEI